MKHGSIAPTQNEVVPGMLTLSDAGSLRFWLQPAFYALHGWLATEMALWMLFRPYEKKVIPFLRWPIPFTPGIFPRGRYKLSKSIATTITEILLTQADIEAQARKLVNEGNIYSVVDAFTQSVASELGDIHHIRKFYGYIREMAPVVVEKLCDSGFDALRQGNSRVIGIGLDHLFKELSQNRLSDEQGLSLAQGVCQTLLAPDQVRGMLLGLLTPKNAHIIQQLLKERIKGLQGLLLNFLQVDKGFVEGERFLREQPLQANQLIEQLMADMDIEGKLATYFTEVSLSQISMETLDRWKQVLADVICQTLLDNEPLVRTALKQGTEQAAQSISNALITTDWPTVLNHWLPDIKRDVARAIYLYLNQDLTALLSQALPLISLNNVIIEKIDQFSAQQLEQTIQRICRSELRGLALLGALLGFWLGLISNLMVGRW